MSIAVGSDLRRDVRVMSLIGVAHGLSHFYQTVLLVTLGLAALRDTFGVNFVALSAVATVFYVISGFGQFAAGFIVDRVGARNVLLFGLTTAGLGIAGVGFAESYWQLIVAAAIAGCGNAVFHPADYAILNASVHGSRLGRSYSLHSLLGTLGWAAAPAMIVSVLQPQVGWRVAVIALGSIGPLLALMLASQSTYFNDHRRMTQQASRGEASLRARARSVASVLFQTSILLCFGYFALLSITIVGLQAAAIPSLHGVYGLPEQAGSFALSSMLVASAIGVGVGGFVADKVSGRHDVVASLGMLLAGCFMATVASGVWAPHMVWLGLGLVGFSSGMTTPSRDMIVRAATPPGASGKVFGFVYSGLDAGSALSPVLFALLLNNGLPAGVLYLVAALYVLSVVTVLNIRRIGRPTLAPAQ